MSQAGYTLAETLVALTIVGLAFGGLAAGAQQLGLWQGKTRRSLAHTEAAAQVTRGFADFLQGEGPFRSDDRSGLEGDADHFEFPCGDRACSAELVRAGAQTDLRLTGRNGRVAVLPIRPAAAYAFSYEDEAGEEVAWPPTNAQTPRTLRGVAILRPRLGDISPIAEARVFAEQPANCQFDSISRTCRATQ